MVEESQAVSAAEQSPKGRALAAAKRILLTQGVERLSLRAIAEAAGIGTTSIYHYFANKDELLLTLARSGFADLKQHILAFQADPRFDSEMQASARAFFDFADTFPALFALMFEESLLARFEALREAERETLMAYQAVVEADPRVPAGEGENVAFALWALGRGMASIMSSYPEGRMPPEIYEKLFAGAFFLVNRDR